MNPAETSSTAVADHRPANVDWRRSLLGLAVFLGFWQTAGLLNLMPRALLPLPSAIPTTWFAEVAGGYWTRAVRESLGHYLLGLLIGSVLGIGAGVVTALSPGFEASQTWVVRILRPIPGLAWVPFAIVWFGITSTAATFIIAVSVFWLNYFAALTAVQVVDRDLIELATAFGHGSLSGRLRKVLLPAAAPGIMTGFRTGLGQAWMAVVAAELFGIPGVGARMMQAASLLEANIVVVYMLTMALLYGVTDMLFMMVQRRLLAWQLL
jgi:sulfonate transport system permease protein